LLDQGEAAAALEGFSRAEGLGLNHPLVWSGKGEALVLPLLRRRSREVRVAPGLAVPATSRTRRSRRSADR
jgi:hypothetical protein